MTQKRMQVCVFAALFVLGVNTAWGEVKKEASCELLPAPKCCCEQSGSSNHGCCATTNSCSCCTKQVHEVCLENRQDEDRVYTKIYPVGKLLWPAEPVILPIGNQELFLGWATQTPNGPRLQEDSPEDQLISLIRNTISPTCWRDQGGRGTIDYFPTNQTLVVHQTPVVQEQVADLLAALGRLQAFQKEELSATLPPIMAVPPPPPVAPPLPGAPFNMVLPPVPPMPPLLAERVPPPHVLAGSPLPPLCPSPALMPAGGLWPAPPVQPIPLEKAYILEATMVQVQPNGKAVNSMRAVVAFRPDSHFYSTAITGREVGPEVVESRPDPRSHCSTIPGQETDKEYRKWLLMIKATPLKNERVRLEVVDVEGKADQAGDGKLALDLNATPILDRKVKPGDMAKKVLEKDEHGKPRKWLELIVKELPPAPAGAVCPGPAEASTPAPVATGMFPMPCLSAPLAYQPVSPGIAPEPVMSPWIAPEPTMSPYLGSRPVPGSLPGVSEGRPRWLIRQVEEDPAWNLRPILEEGKSKLIVREGDRDSVTLKSLVVKIPGNEALKLTAAGSQIRVQNGCLQAHADKVCRTGEAGCFLFEGHVKLTYKKNGELAKVRAERVFVNLTDGRIEIQDAARVCPAPPLDE